MKQKIEAVNSDDTLIASGEQMKAEISQSEPETMDATMQGSSSLYQVISKPVYSEESAKKLPQFLKQIEYRQFEDNIEESEENLTAMYAEMILRNKRFKPTFPVREQLIEPQ